MARPILWRTIRRLLQPIYATGGQVVAGSNTKNSSTLCGPAGQPPHQTLLPNQPICGCCAARKGGGIVCLFAISRLRCSFGSRFLGLDGCSCLASDGCICANASRSLALTGTLVTVAGGGMLASPLATCAGMMI